MLAGAAYGAAADPGQGVQAHQPAAEAGERQEDRGDRVLLVCLPALRRLRGAAAGLAQAQAQGRGVQGGARWCSATTGSRWPSSTTRWRRWALLDKYHVKVFEAIHKDRASSCSTDQAVIKWAAKQGIDAGKFDQVYNSFGIDAKVQRAVAMGRAYGVQFTPALAVNGKYLTGPSMVTSPDGGLDMPRFFEVVDQLIVMERGKRAATTCGRQDQRLSRDSVRMNPAAPPVEPVGCGAAAAVAGRRGRSDGGGRLSRHSAAAARPIPTRIEVVEFFYYGCHWCNECRALRQGVAPAQAAGRRLPPAAGHAQHALDDADQGVLRAGGRGQACRVCMDSSSAPTTATRSTSRTRPCSPTGWSSTASKRERVEALLASPEVMAKVEAAREATYAYQVETHALRWWWTGAISPAAAWRAAWPS